MWKPLPNTIHATTRLINGYITGHVYRNAKYTLRKTLISHSDFTKSSIKTKRPFQASPRPISQSAPRLFLETQTVVATKARSEPVWTTCASSTRVLVWYSVKAGNKIIINAGLQIVALVWPGVVYPRPATGGPFRAMYHDDEPK